MARGRKEAFPHLDLGTMPSSVMGILVGQVKHGIGFIGSALMCFQHIN